MIPLDLYSKIHALMPIPCVDLCIVRKRRVLILKRTREPDASRFWFPGGRLMRNETVVQAVHRIALGEVSLTVEPLRFLDWLESRFPTDPFGHGKGTHTVSLVFLCRLVGPSAQSDGDPVKVDDNHSEHRWWDGADGAPEEIPDQVRVLIRKGLNL